MKKFTKISLIIASTLAGLGMLCILAGIIIGVSWPQLYNTIPFTKQVDYFFSMYSSEDNHEDAVGASEHTEEGNQVHYSFDQADEVYVEISAGTFKLETTTQDQISVDANEKMNVKAYISENELHVTSHVKKVNNLKDTTIVVKVPEKLKLNKFRIEMAAGTAEVAALNCSDYEIEMAAGTMDMVLAGEQKSYNYDFECAAGSIQIGDDAFNGIAMEKEIKNEGATGNVDIECAAGDVNISFRK